MRHLSLTVFVIGTLTVVENVSISGSSQLEIINGDKIKPHSIKYIVYIDAQKYNKKGELKWFSCGGTLLSKKHVLTAAHCVHEAEAVKVTVGAHWLSEENKVITAKKWVLHEKYKDYQNNDIAIVYLEEDVPDSKNIEFVQLVKESKAVKVYDGKEVQVYGWGRIDKTISADELRAASQTVTSLDKCKRKVTFLHICTTPVDGKSACKGDSGGPLMYKGAQIGILSSIADDCAAAGPNIYTYVGPFLNWIKGKMD